MFEMNQEQLQAFASVLVEPTITALLSRRPDIDRYNIAAIFAYFLRAKLEIEEFNGKNFAICLYIDNMIQV